MAPPKFRKDSRSGSSKGGRFGQGPGKPGPGKPHSRNASPGKPPKGGKPGRPPGKPAYAKETLNRAPGKHPRPEYAKDKHSRPAGKPAYPKYSRPAAKPYNPGPDTRPQRPERGDRPAKQENWLYGLHAVTAALTNPRRKLGRVVLTPRVLGLIDPELLDGMRVETMELGAIDRLLPPGAVHQGAALEAAPLPQVDFEALLAAPSDGHRRVVLVLDQLSDPHNVGAILRSAAAFGVTAVVVQDRHAPPQSGALAKAASGALDTVPYVEVVNITRALEKLGEHGFWRIALAGDGDTTLAQAVPQGDVALVMGSEGDGIRRLVRENCDVAASIPIEGVMESLNVSNAAAIALYELRRS
jgi:23S rRNA (guanosine2251-2'-O)-methyltransferase